MSNKNYKDFFKGFSRLTYSKRLTSLLEGNFFTSEDLSYLKKTGTKETLKIINQLVENVIGCFQLPLGIAPHFRIDDEDYVIPMAVEETSVIAAASGTAKWLREHGKITTKNIGYHAIGQIQLPQVENVHFLKKQIKQYKTELIEELNLKVIPNFVKRGGGVQDIIVRTIKRDSKYNMVILHVLIHTCDAMGGNAINQVCEYLKTPIEKLTGERVALCILSNLTESKLTSAKVCISNIDSKLGKAIAEAWLFAELDPYRAVTHNKGILNGIDAVLVATGNDWRAVEAGMHAYAARTGRYKPLTKWEWTNNTLVGTLKAPIVVGVVGGVTKTHPTAKLSLRLLRVTNAPHLARIVAAVGLVQNLAALRALTTNGIVNGHMKLHLNNLLLAAGVAEDNTLLKQQLQDHLKKHNKITLSDVQQFKKRQSSEE